MQIKQLKVAGFRGFNDEGVVDFDERLTVISAANSHGKTSISEALEFLLYGTTSKVDKADSKEEYKDSYRNRHYPADKPAYVEAVFSSHPAKDTVLRVELDNDETVRRFVNGTPVTEWPFHKDSLIAARPFVLQHALKYLLLVAPSERFQGFAQLLGMNEVDDVFRAILGLCTKPSANIPDEGQRLLSDFSSLELRIAAIPELKNVATALKKGLVAIDKAYKGIDSWSEKFLGAEKGDRLTLLVAARALSAAKVYSGSVSIPFSVPAEEARLAATRKTLSTAIDVNFLEDYARLCVSGVAAKLQKEAQLLELGTELLNDDPDACPLCRRTVDDKLRRAIHERHKSVDAETKKDSVRVQALGRVTRALDSIKRAGEQNALSISEFVESLRAAMSTENEPKVTELLGGPDAASVAIIRTSAITASSLCTLLSEAAEKVRLAIEKCEQSIQNSKPILSDAEALAQALQDYLAVATDVIAKIRELEPLLVGPEKLLRQAVDQLAGTAQISLAIELLQKRSAVEKALRIREVLESLKEMKRHAEQTLAEVMDNAMSADLTSAVMKWYLMIKTTGDPDVHFSGFAMDRTKGGDFKSRRLSVKAKSYGVELASAVSSLSKSKLNALGLCVSIASSLRRPGPWSFLIIDDPIQSWDDEHETQFINVIRSLIDSEKRQVVVLTHKVTWAKQVCDGCRSLNGIRYEITGYAKTGPEVRMLEWSSLDDRLREAQSITDNTTASSVQLQQAEEEIRLAACQLASTIAAEKLGRTSSPHNMNKKDVRAILLAAGVPSEAADRLNAMFVNADDSHHVPKTYQPNAQRIRQAIASIREVRKLTQN